MSMLMKIQQNVQAVVGLVLEKNGKNAKNVEPDFVMQNVKHFHGNTENIRKFVKEFK